MWDALTRKQKQGRWDYCRKKARTLEAVKAKVAAGTANRNQQTFALRGGHRLYGTPEERAATQKATALRRRHIQNQYVSEDRLKFRLEHSKGCSVPDCVLGPVDGVEPLISLIHHSHLGGMDHGKMHVSTLPPSKKVAALEKTTCLCRWHQFQKNKGAAETDPGIVGSWKEITECEHLLHESMPYAKMITSTNEDPSVRGFFDVSHVVLGQAGNKRLGPDEREKRYIADLLSGAAVVHCKFCHALWTLCEDSMLYDTPLTNHQKTLLATRHPEFVADFEDKTRGFDWKAEKMRLDEVMAEGKLKAKEKKRKGTDPSVKKKEHKIS